MVSGLWLHKLEQEEKTMNDELTHSEAAMLGQSINISVQKLIQQNRAISLESVKELVFTEIYPMLCTLRKEFADKKKHFGEVAVEEKEIKEIQELEDKMIKLM